MEVGINGGEVRNQLIIALFCWIGKRVTLQPPPFIKFDPFTWLYPFPFRNFPLMRLIFQKKKGTIIRYFSANWAILESERILRKCMKSDITSPVSLVVDFLVNVYVYEPLLLYTDLTTVKFNHKNDFTYYLRTDWLHELTANYKNHFIPFISNCMINLD